MNIQFQNSNILFLLFALLIPIIIHLFNFRKYQTIYFSNIRLLKNFKIENNKTKSKFKQIAILISRLLVFTFLILAFSYPILQQKNNTVNKKTETVCVYIDNSFSTSAENKQGKIFEQIKKKAQLISKAYPATTNFKIFTNDFTSTDEISLNQKQLLDKISKIILSSKSHTISEVITRTSSIASLDHKKFTTYLISDFQKNICDFDKIENDTNSTIIFAPIEIPVIQNIYIDSCWFDKPFRVYNQTDEITIQVKNSGNEEYIDLPLKLFINDSLKTITSFSIKGNSSEEIKLKFTNFEKGEVYGRIEISDFPIIYDNTYFFSYIIPEKISVLNINDNKYIQSMFSKDSGFVFTQNNQNQLNYSILNNYNIIFLSKITEISTGLQSELLNYIESGGTVAILPSLKADVNNLNEFLSIAGISITGKSTNVNSRISKIDKDHFLYNSSIEEIKKNTSFPQVKSYFDYIIKNKTNATKLITLDNDKIFLTHSSYKTGSLYVFCNDLNDSLTEFSKHPLIIPTLYNMALYSKSQTPIQYFISSKNEIQLSSSSNIELIKITSKSNNSSFIPKIRNLIDQKKIALTINDEITEAGHYSINDKTNTLLPISLNYSRSESLLEYFNTNEITDQIEKNDLVNSSVLSVNDSLIKDTIQNIDTGFRLWKIMILLCLFFIIIEVVLIRVL